MARPGGTRRDMGWDGRKRSSNVFDRRAKEVMHKVCITHARTVNQRPAEAVHVTTGPREGHRAYTVK